MTTQQIEATVLELPRYERLRIAHLILDSLVEIENTDELKSAEGQDGSVPTLYDLHKYASDIGPEDFSTNLDHYLYGLPKRDE